MWGERQQQRQAAHPDQCPPQERGREIPRLLFEEAVWRAVQNIAKELDPNDH